MSVVTDFSSVRILKFLFTLSPENSISIFLIFTCFCISLSLMHVLTAQNEYIIEKIPICLCKDNSICFFTKYICIYLLLYCHYTNKDWFWFLFFVTSYFRPYPQKPKFTTRIQKVEATFSVCVTLHFSLNILICYFVKYLTDIVESLWSSAQSSLVLRSIIILYDLKILAVTSNSHNFTKTFYFLCATRNTNFRKKSISSHPITDAFRFLGLSDQT